jgi:hypothetical protein
MPGAWDVPRMVYRRDRPSTILRQILRNFRVFTGWFADLDPTSL